HRHAHARRAGVRARRVRQGRPRARNCPVRRQNRLAAFLETYTRDLTADDLQRLFTRDTRDAYRFFARHIDRDALEALPWHRRMLAHVRLLFMAFAMKLSPARRILYGASLVFAVLGLLSLFQGGRPLLRSVRTPQGEVRILMPRVVGFPDGTGALVLAL